MITVCCFVAFRDIICIGMGNLEKSSYWFELANDDLKVAKCLLDSKYLLHCGYFCHQIVEKSIKALIIKNTNTIPPKTHDLARLAKLASIYELLTTEQLFLIDRLTPLQIEARYPEYKDQISKTLSCEICENLLKEVETFLCWTKTR
ncbi:MAG: HEPN domain-containing protein [Christensenellaceae bacterium]|jgi:HEPN domain-containing protein|nr:HEPN domain-containing protein [Christensenellaceae bacterium]